MQTAVCSRHLCDTGKASVENVPTNSESGPDFLVDVIIMKDMCFLSQTCLEVLDACVVALHAL